MDEDGAIRSTPTEGSTGLTLGEPSAFIVFFILLLINFLIYSSNPDLLAQGNDAATVGDIHSRQETTKVLDYARKSSLKCPFCAYSKSVKSILP
jgi:hypothetical protein